MTKLREWTVSATLTFLWACGSPEQATIDQFFRAAQTNDSTTLAYMSAVGSPVPVESWKVVEVTSRTTEPFTLPELLEKFQAAEKEREAAQEERTKYAKDNQEALEQIIPKLREDPEYKFRGKLGAIQEEWTKLLDKRKEEEQVYQELKQVVNEQTGLASKSVVRQVSLANFQGNVAVTEMLVNLKAREGAELPFKITLRKYDVTESPGGRPEPARWVISDIEGATPEAQAAAAAAAAPKARPAAAESAQSAAAAESDRPAPRDAAYTPRELRGLARVQMLNPDTKVEGEEVVSRIRVRNVSRDWIAGFMVTEHWYDDKGNAVGSGSRTHRERFMPGEVLALELRTRKSANFFQNQFEFTHANGTVNAAVVGSFPNND
jgi:hypothetical protein